MKDFKCKDGTVITYRYPNVPESFMLKHHAGYLTPEFTGFGAIGGVLANCSNLILKVEGTHNNWKDCLFDKSMEADLTNIALDIWKVGVTEEEKKS